MKRPAATLFLLFSMLAATAWSQTPAHLGPEFQVNTYTTSNQSLPSVAASSTGEFVVVWSSRGSADGDTDLTSIQAQRFAADASPVGSQFQVNTYTTGDQYWPNVGMDPRGEFVVVWQSGGHYSAGPDGPDGDLGTVQARRYAANGDPLSGEFQVNTYTTDTQYFPDVAASPAGGFVVVWASRGSSASDNSFSSVQARRYAANGSAIGGEFQVNTYTTSWQYFPQLAIGATGEFVVVWTSDGSTGSDDSIYSVQGRRFAADGQALGGEFQINTITTGRQLGYSVAKSPVAGEFIVTWGSETSAGSDPTGLSVQGQRFATDGTALGSQFQINTYTISWQYGPIVRTRPSGEFVVVWHSLGSFGSDTSDYSVKGQRFAAAGAPIGGEFQVNTSTTGTQKFPSLAVVSVAEFAVVWWSTSSAGTDVTTGSIQGQRFEIPFFADGFESGDTTAWSGTQ